MSEMFDKRSRSSRLPACAEACVKGWRAFDRLQTIAAARWGVRVLGLPVARAPTVARNAPSRRERRGGLAPDSRLPTQRQDDMREPDWQPEPGMARR